MYRRSGHPRMLGVLFAAWGATLASGQSGVIHPGETVSARMPAGDPASTRVEFELTVDASGGVTLDAESLDFTRVGYWRLRAERHHAVRPVVGNLAAIDFVQQVAVDNVPGPGRRPQ